MTPSKFLIPTSSMTALRLKAVRSAYDARDFVKTIVEAEELLLWDVWKARCAQARGVLIIYN